MSNPSTTDVHIPSTNRNRNPKRDKLGRFAPKPGNSERSTAGQKPDRATTTGQTTPPARQAKEVPDLTPTKAMQEAAARGLEWRRQYGRGGTPVGVARARDIVNGKQLSPQTIARMVSFFARHGNNRAEHYELRDGKPTTWRIAWDLWGGDAGRTWANEKRDQMENVTKANHAYDRCMMCKEQQPAIDVLWNEGRSRAWFCDKCFNKWAVEKGPLVVSTNRLKEGLAPKRYRITHSPKERKPMNKDTVLKINGERVTLGDLLHAWLEKAERFTSAPWSSPESDLSAEDFAKVCLIDLNPPGEDKVKANCKLPYKSTPNGPVNLNALRAIASRLPQTDAPADALKAAARKLVNLMRAAGLEPGETTLERAGMVEKDERVEKPWEFEGIAKDAKRQVVYGVILRPNAKDKQGDIIDPDEIMTAAHVYMAKRAGAADLHHQEEISRSRAVMVESFVMGADVDNWHGQAVKLVKGSWVGGMWIPDRELWGQVESGAIKAFSIRGFGKRKVIG